MRNYWTDRIKEKERLEEADKKAQEKKDVLPFIRAKALPFVPPIYKKIGDPTHPLYGIQPAKKTTNWIGWKKQNWIVWGHSSADNMYLSTKAFVDSMRTADNLADLFIFFDDLKGQPARFIALEDNGDYYLQFNPDSKDHASVIIIDVSDLKAKGLEWVGMKELQKALHGIETVSEANELFEYCISLVN